MQTKKQTHLILILALIAMSLNLTAQVKTKVFYSGIPSKFKPLLKQIAKTQKIEPPAEFYNRKQKNPDEEIQFAIPVKVNIDFLKESILEETASTLTYSLLIEAKDALNLSLQFSEFNLPETAIFSIYTQNELTDSITSSQNNENNIWATRVYQGNTLSIVLKVPKTNKERAALKIGSINFGYKKFGVQFDFGNPGASEPCHINANCPAGNNWNNEKNSVAMIVANGIVQCTGSLVMNTCNTNTPYFLTANHCLNAGNVPNWVFQFQTLSTDCATNTGWREDVQFNGCTLRANNGASDFALLQLNTTPPANSGLFYSGWSRQTTGNMSTTVLHHPAGDLMKISVDNQDPASLTSFGVDVWQIDQDLGRLQGGSSGAPYYNQNHQIIGQHWRRPEAGTRPICDITVAQGGRFDRSWTGGGTNATRLSNWLDPNNSGIIMTTNTTNIANLVTTPTLPTVTGYYTVNGGTTQTSIAGDTYQQLYVPRSSIVTIRFFITTNNFLSYNWSYDNVTSTGLQFTANFTAPATGYSSITKYVNLAANDGCGIVNRIYTFQINSLGWSLRVVTSPNPTSDKLNIAITKIDDNTDLALNEKNGAKQVYNSSKTTFVLYDINTNHLVKQWTYNEVSLMNYSLDIKGLKAGVYVLKTEREGQSITSRIIIK